jgi:hypothetical protein
VSRSTFVTLEVRCAYCSKPLVARERCAEYIAETVDYYVVEGSTCLSCILCRRFVERTVAAKGEDWARTHLESMFLRYMQVPETMPPPRAAPLFGKPRELNA